MDLERSVAGKAGIPELYKFTQTLTTCTITFKVSCPRPQITINQEESTILVVEQDKNLVICGVTYGKFFKNSTTNVENEYTITLSKEERTIWPLLINRPSSHGIDRKSLFVLGLEKDASGDYKSAFQYWLDAANQGFIAAKLLVADILMSDINNYDVSKDVDRGISLLTSIPIEKQNTDIILCLAHALIDQKKKQEAADRIRMYLQVHDDNTVRLALVDMLSPFGAGLLNYPEEAVYHLQILADRKNAQATRLLAQHYYKGIGVKSDKKKARELDQKACEINPEFTPMYQKGIGQNIAIAAGVSTLFVGACAMAWKKFSK